MRQENAKYAIYLCFKHSMIHGTAIMRVWYLTALVSIVKNKYEFHFTRNFSVYLLREYTDCDYPVFYEFCSLHSKLGNTAEFIDDRLYN